MMKSIRSGVVTSTMGFNSSISFVIARRPVSPLASDSGVARASGSGSDPDLPARKGVVGNRLIDGGVVRTEGKDKGGSCLPGLARRGMGRSVWERG